MRISGVRFEIAILRVSHGIQKQRVALFEVTKLYKDAEGHTEGADIRFLVQRGAYYVLPDLDSCFFTFMSEIVEQLPVPTIGRGRHFF